MEASRQSTDRPTVLVPSGVYLPGHKGGGPIRSISNLIERLSDTFDFRVLASVENLEESDADWDYRRGEWISVGPAQVRYLEPWEQTFPYLSKLLLELDFDVVYLNSFFPTAFERPVLALRRSGLLGDCTVVLAPRGQFYEGAFRQKNWKKEPFVDFVRTAGIYDDVVWQATTDEEKCQIERLFGDDAEVRIAPNLGTLPYHSVEQKDQWAETQPGELRAAFVSRISPKKNLDGALRMLRHVDGDVSYDIFGPTWDDDYWAECEEIIQTLPPNVTVNYEGAIPHEQVFEEFASHDLFLFPTHGENFGHVIFESLVSGCPVLIGEDTPWADVEQRGVGWSYPVDDEPAFVERLQRCIDADEEDYRPIRRRAVEFALQKEAGSDKVEKTRRLFEFAARRAGVRMASRPRGFDAVSTSSETAPVSAIVLTYNEEENIADCLESLEGWVDELFVVDSFSTDRTVEIAEEYTDLVFEHEFEHYAAQRNWAQSNLPIDNEWILHLDADERVSRELAEEITERLTGDEPEVDGFLVAERSYFMGRWIRHGDMYPVYHLRLFRRDRGRCEQRNYDQHYLCDGEVETLKHDLVEENEFNLEAWTARHNRWSSAEARETALEKRDRTGTDTVDEKLFGTPIERRRWLKNRLFYQLPLFARPFAYFLYRYVVKKGFLDGVEGLIYHVLQGFWFRFLVDAKIYELRRKSEND